MTALHDVIPTLLHVQATVRGTPIYDSLLGLSGA